MSETYPNPQPNEDTARRLGELVVSLAKEGFDVYIDISVREGEEPEWEYTEVPRRESLNTDNFMRGDKRG